MVDINFRKAEKSDINEIAVFVENAIKVMDSQKIFQWDEIYPTKEDFEDDFSNDNLYVGQINGKLAVVFTLNNLSDEEYKNGNWQYPEKPYIVIHRLCVNPEFQNKGVGHNTILYIEELLKNKGIQAIRLDAFSQNPYSLRMYDKLGFKKVGEASWRKGLFYLMEKYI